jgi:hypothetical protein
MYVKRGFQKGHFKKYIPRIFQGSSGDFPILEKKSSMNLPPIFQGLKTGYFGHFLTKYFCRQAD